MSNENFRPFNAAQFLETEEAIAAFMDAVMEECGDDPGYVACALGVVAHARARLAGTADPGEGRTGD